MKSTVTIQAATLGVWLLLTLVAIPSGSDIALEPAFSPTWDIVVEDFERGTLNGWETTQAGDSSLINGGSVIVSIPEL